MNCSCCDAVLILCALLLFFVVVSFVSLLVCSYC